MVERNVRGKLAALLSAVDDILALEEPDAILRRSVEVARKRVGLRRAAIFLYDSARDMMLGTGHGSAGRDRRRAPDHVFVERRRSGSGAPRQGGGRALHGLRRLPDHRAPRQRDARRRPRLGRVDADRVGARHHRHVVQRRGAVRRTGRRDQAGARRDSLFAARDDSRPPARHTGSGPARHRRDADAAPGEDAPPRYSPTTRPWKRRSSPGASRSPPAGSPASSRPRWGCRCSNIATASGSIGSTRFWNEATRPCLRPRAPPASAATPSSTGVSRRSPHDTGRQSLHRRP